MKLKKAIEILTSKRMTEEEAYTNLQRSYDFVVKHIRLNQSVHPAKFNRAFRIAEYGDSDNYTILLSSNSQMCFKEILSYVKTEDASEYLDAYDIDSLIIGDLDTYDKGFFNFDSLNNEHMDNPRMYQIGNDVVCTNVEEGYCLIQGYVYPYPCKTVNGITVDEHRYDIRWMSDTYSENGLDMDNMLTIPIILGALGLYCRDNADMVGLNNYNKLVSNYLNIFNKKPATPRIDNWSSVDPLTPGSIRL